MSNIPPWFLQAVEYGTVEGKPIPKWFPKEEKVEFVNKHIGGGDKPVFKPNEVSDTVNNDNTTPQVMKSDRDFSGWPAVSKGATYRKDQVKNWSYYNTPIVDRPMRGRSRVWGDADPDVINAVRSLILDTANSNGLDVEDMAMLLAMAHTESGFNPDAAAGPSSASGIGQFINDTGKKYGINNQTRWDVNEQVRAFVEHYMDNKKRSGEHGINGIYVLHYAGSFNNGSHTKMGWNLVQKKILPLYKKYLEALSK